MSLPQGYAKNPYRETAFGSVDDSDARNLGREIYLTARVYEHPKDFKFLLFIRQIGERSAIVVLCVNVRASVQENAHGFRIAPGNRSVEERITPPVSHIDVRARLL